MSTPSIRAALERLIELDKGIEGISGISGDDWTDAIAAARTAVAQPEGEGPSDAEAEAWADKVGFIKGNGDHPCGFWIDENAVGAVIRAALARWGCPATPPAPEVGWPSDDELLAMRSWSSHGPTFDSDLVDFGRRCYNLAKQPVSTPYKLPAPPAPEAGEVEELVAWMRGQVAIAPAAQTQWAKRFLRIATLLQQLSAPAPAPKPIPVSERLPGVGEVGELAAWLENHAAHLRKMQEIGAWPETELQEMLDRAATLLQQQQHILGLACAELDRMGAFSAAPAPAVVPVAVSERPWEREGWRDAEGRCWWGRPSEELCNSDWYLATRDEVEEFCSECMPIVSLPHNAIPLPQAGEVEA